MQANGILYSGASSFSFLHPTMPSFADLNLGVGGAVMPFIIQALLAKYGQKVTLLALVSSPILFFHKVSLF